ncbi:MAG TPA: SusC/RagA family TonB-linked outer membrane protein [Puia sp.]|nr:SusC/RagA family TonB-linked outer membrane protein [Puia sp.]
MQIDAFRKLLSYVHKDSKSLLTKTILVMKLSAILILVTTLHVAARSTAQKVTYSGKAVELPKVLSAIREQTGYVFFYDKKYMQDISPITVSLKDAPVELALKTILQGLPLDFEIQGNTIFINRKTPVAKEAPEEPRAAPEDTIRGVVRDSTGAPLQGASVLIKGTKKGTRTDLKGSFALRRSQQMAVLVISYTGYQDKEVAVSGDGPLFIFLQRSEDPLDATVVQAYGTTSRRFSVGSISTVTAEAIEKQPVTNVLLALAGQAPGLAITATSGVPGSRVQVQIRGQNTVLSDPNQFLKPYDQPLFIVDGVPFAPQNANINQLSTLAEGSSYNGGISQAGGLSPFNNINPNDIESISILKDADATSIYGTQGSNGVILITTKKGKPGKTAFNLTANTGYNTDARPIKLLNTQQYLQLRKEAFAADGVTPGNDPNNYYAYAPDLTVYDPNKYTNWQKTIFGKTSNNTDVHGSLSGGNYNNTFIVSAGYTRSDFNFPGNSADQRLTLHSAIHHTSPDNHLTIDFGTDYGYDQNNSAGSGAGQRILLPPNTPDLLDAKGNLVWNYKGVDLSSSQFYVFLKEPTEAQNYNLNNSLRIAYKLFSGLSISANLGYSRNTTSEKSQVPSTAQSPLYAPYISAQFATGTFETVNVEPQIDYTYARGKGLFTALLGAAYKKNVQNSNSISAYGYANDNFLGSVDGATSISDYDQSNIYKYSAGFARLKYIYDQKYIVSLTGRRDGSSNFGPGNQFGNFGSAGAGWIFSEEKFFKEAVPFISYGKLSGNYGTSGSDGVAAYRYQAFWQPVGYIPAFQGVQPSVPTNLYNPNYSWALKKSLNTALDLGFFHDRLLFNATYYRDREGNQLGGYPLGAHVGFTSVLENLPATVQNSGWEFTVSSNNIKTKAVTWTTTFNISFNRNKLLAFPNLEGSSYSSIYILGKPVSEIMGYRFKGLNPTTGLFEYYTKGGQATSTPAYGIASQGGDQTPIANREVKYMGGFGNSLSYKHFNLYVFFQFSSQTAPNYMYTIYSSYTPTIGTNNLPVQVLDHWKNPGDHATFEKLTTTYGTPAATAGADFSGSTGAYSDDTYVRLKTLSLSYSLPESWLKKMHLHDLRIYANAQNLLTITDYKVADPEQFNDYTLFPLQRTVAFGLNLNF